MTVTYLSPYGGVSPHVFIHANDTHPLETIGIIDQQARPFGQDSGVGGIPGHAQGLGDACTVRWWTTRPVSAQRTAARESLARGSAAALMF